jgi:signal transduction histidine kinase/ActR/RegA family two-component response regulator
MLERQAARIPDIYVDARIPHDAYRPTFVKSLAMVPIRSSDPIGAIGAYWPEQHLTSDEELLALQTIADSASVALTNVELIHSLRAARDQVGQLQRLQAVGQLAAVVAHDFNNLLVPMLGYCELLGAQLADREDLHSMVVEIEHAAERAQGISQQLLAFSRKQPAKPARIDLNEIIRDLERLLRRLAGSQAAVVLDLWPEPQIVNVDRGQVDQVLLNLVANARDAMPDGGQITIATRPADSPLETLSREKYTVLVVRDTGTGMPLEIQEKVFDPFFTTKEPGRGTGLGLSTVHAVVTESGGTVFLQSAVGQGTTFEIRLPRADTADARRAAQATELPRGDEAVLIVEDERSIRNLSEILLKSQGYRAKAVATGDEAWGLVHESGERFDLVMIDMGLPDTSGLKLARRIAENHGTPILLMSGHPPEWATTGKGPQEFAFLVKPFTREQLLRAVRETLDAAKATKSSDGTP